MKSIAQTTFMQEQHNLTIKTGKPKLTKSKGGVWPSMVIHAQSPQISTIKCSTLLLEVHASEFKQKTTFFMHEQAK